MRIRIVFVIAALMMAAACHSSNTTTASITSMASPSSAATKHSSQSDSESGSADQPVTEDDIQLYLKVMHAAADRMKALPQSDKALLQKFVAMSKGQNVQLDADQINRAMELSNLDDQVAKEMHVDDRYANVKAAVVGLEVGCRGCSGDAAGAPERTPEQKKQDEADAAQQKQQFEMLDKHKSEIMSLEKIVHPGSPQTALADAQSGGM